MRSLPTGSRALVIVAGLVTLGASAYACRELALNWRWLPLPAVLASLAVEFLKVDFTSPGGQRRSSVTMGVLSLFLVLGLYGLPWALVAGLLQVAVTSARNRTVWYKWVCNGGVTLAPILAADLVLLAPGAPVLTEMLAALAAVLTFVIINTGSVALVIAQIHRQNAWQIWWESYTWTAVVHTALGLMGLALARVLGNGGWFSLFLLAPVPVLHATYWLYVVSQRQHTQQLRGLVEELITTLGAVVDARDAYTFGHSAQVARYAEAIGRRMGLSFAELEDLRQAALLHDIGKVGIPEQVLFKPGRLTPEEFRLMKEHTGIGYRIISRIHSLHHAAEVAWQHHERFDGRGYPRGLAGARILRDARIVCVADALETMLSDRPYREGCSLGEALAEVRRCAGTQFDPEVVGALLAVAAAEGPGFFVNSAALVPQGEVAAGRRAGWPGSPVHAAGRAGLVAQIAPVSQLER